MLDRGAVAGGTTGAGEGNLLVSDKSPGPELDLTAYSLDLWHALSSTLDGDAMELDSKGGLVVASTEDGHAALRAFAERQRAAGVRSVEVAAEDLSGHEPHLAGGFAGGVFYPQDMQVQPMAAAAHLLRAAVRDHGAAFHPGQRVTAIERALAPRVAPVPRWDALLAGPGKEVSNVD